MFLFNEDTNYVEPDISVICDPYMLHEDGCHGAPDWIIEVVSPSSRKMDCIIKPEIYGNAGVREYWIVDAKEERVCVYSFAAGNEEDYTFKDTVRAAIYSDLYIDFTEIL